MARGTVTHDTGMIKYGTNKGAAGAVTHATIFSGRNVCRRFSRGSGISAIMAASAIPIDAVVTEDRGTKRRGGMAEVTILGSG